MNSWLSSPTAMTMATPAMVSGTVMIWAAKPTITEVSRRMPKMRQNAAPEVSCQERANAEKTPRPSSTMTAVTKARRVHSHR